MTALAAGVVEITATSVDTGSDGKPVSQTCTVTVLGLTPLQATVNAQIETEEGLSWVTIDLSMVAPPATPPPAPSSPVQATAAASSTAPTEIMRTPVISTRWTRQTASQKPWVPKAPPATACWMLPAPRLCKVTFGDHEVTAFDRPVFIAQGQRLSLLDFQEGTALGWGPGILPHARPRRHRAGRPVHQRRRKHDLSLPGPQYRGRLVPAWHPAQLL